jgi:hypothetical protein
VVYSVAPARGFRYSSSTSACRPCGVHRVDHGRVLIVGVMVKAKYDVVEQGVIVKLQDRRYGARDTGTCFQHW